MLRALRDLGLCLTLREGGRSLAVAVACGLTFGAWMALADATMLRGAVPPIQREMVAQFTIAQRLAFNWWGALGDEVALRLGVVTTLAWLARRCGLGGWRAFWPAILAAALLVWPLTVLPYLSSLHWSALALVREVLLHGAAGVLWGWLYCRHGWLAGLAGHWAAHVALQPLLWISS
ncbi:hypothetical protein ACFOD9_11125 [Novosphingobium bradum]|uniref:CPBP family intramembrane metalloprotease n=1 Tax=Novosphingobium bradum TaxID=1737444 RepID=A0ABV7IVQ6_9SPHN